MKVLVLLNPKSGTLAASETHDEPERIRRGFEAAGVPVEVREFNGADLSETVAAARRDGFDTIVAGGGDGTLNSIANAVAGTPLAFGVLPLGTHNHFAKELNVPLDLDEAVAALARGGVRDLDVAEVNGRLFLNFSGLGMHPHMVREREAHQEALGGKRIVGRVLRKAVRVFALGLALVGQLSRLPILLVWITGGGRTMRRITPSVIVCNNPHQMAVFGVENVSCPDRGVLNVYLARANGPVGVVRLLLSAVFRRLGSGNVREFESVCLPELRIALRRRHLPVSIDGEVVDLRTPLQYKVRRGGLRVIVPAENVAFPENAE